MRTKLAGLAKLCVAASWLAACASSPNGAEPPQPAILGAPESEAPSEIPARHGRPRDDSTGDITLDLLDAAPSPTTQLDGGVELAASDAGPASAAEDSAQEVPEMPPGIMEAGTTVRCARGSRSLVGLDVPGQVADTVMLDAQYIYYQRVRPESTTRLRQDIVAVPRAALFDSAVPATAFVVSDEDYAVESLVSGDDGFLYFIAMPMANGTNQGLYRVEKRANVAFESLPVPGGPDDIWPGQLAMDQSYFYLASIGGGGRTLRIVRIARSRDHTREELWSDTSDTNDDSAIGSMSLHQGDIALDRDHVYFTARINQNGAPHQFRVYRVAKEGRRQTPVLVTTISNTYGGLACDGEHLYFSNNRNLERWTLASQQSQVLVPQEGMLEMRYFDGVLSWSPSSQSVPGDAAFFCL